MKKAIAIIAAALAFNAITAHAVTLDQNDFCLNQAELGRQVMMARHNGVGYTTVVSALRKHKGLSKTNEISALAIIQGAYNSPMEASDDEYAEFTRKNCLLMFN